MVSIAVGSVVGSMVGGVEDEAVVGALVVTKSKSGMHPSPFPTVEHYEAISSLCNTPAQQ